MTAAFEAEYARRFSFLMRDKPVIVEAVSVEVTGASIDPGGRPPWTPRSPLRAERRLGEHPPPAGPAALLPGGTTSRTPRSPLRAERRLGEHPPPAGLASPAS
jgi:5-oxoprolinase (ATP-hydrolysing)